MTIKLLDRISAIKNPAERMLAINELLNALRVYMTGYHKSVKASALYKIGDAPFPACLYPIKPFVEYLQRQEKANAH